MRDLGIALAVTLGIACGLPAQETGPQVDVTGRAITLRMASSRLPNVRGELLAAWHDTVWVLAESPRRIAAVRLGDIEEATVPRHGLTATKGLLWGLAVGAASGVGLAAACSQEASDCTGIVPGSMVAGAIFGSIAAISYSISSRRRFQPVSAVDLAPFARFPQGPPPGGFDVLLRPPPRAP